jgi:hypothetical protein
MIIAVALVLSIVQLARDRVCPLATCEDAAFYVIPDLAYLEWGADPALPVVVETCFDDTCTTLGVTLDERVGVQGAEPRVDLAPGVVDPHGEHTMRLSVRASTGRILYQRIDPRVQATTLRPNGSGCPPLCAQWVVAIRPDEPGL